MRPDVKKPFGGYAISFANRPETLEQVFGAKPITPAAMTKVLWAYVKVHGLATK